MDKFLESFYNEHFTCMEDNSVRETAEYKKRSEEHERILQLIHTSLCKVLPARESIGLLNDFNDAMFHLLTLYQYEDFKHLFLSGIQLGIEIAHTKQTAIAVDEIMNLLQQIKEDNS